MHSRIRAESGSVTAEFAAVVPAVMLVLLVSLGSLQLEGEQLRVQSAVADSARLFGRGDPAGAAPVRQVSSRATVSERAAGDLVCVRASVPVELGVLSGIRLAASSCALSDGQ